MDEKNCEFCDRLSLEKQVIYIDNKIVVIYPRNPIITEHLIIATVRHVEGFDDLNEDELLSSMKIIKRIFKAFRDKKKAVGFNLFTNIGKKAGQHVPHFHWNIFVRFDDERISPYKIINDLSLREEITPEQWEEKHKLVTSLING